MDKLDRLVTGQIIDRLLEPERLGTMLSSLASRRAAKAATVDERISTLEREVYDTDDRLLRLYKLIEDGVTEQDDILKDRLIALKPTATERTPHWNEQEPARDRRSLSAGSDRALRPDHAREADVGRDSVPESLHWLDRRPHRGRRRPDPHLGPRGRAGSRRNREWRSRARGSQFCSQMARPKRFELLTPNS